MSLSSGHGVPAVTGGRAAGPGSVPGTGAAIEVVHLRKTYRATVAVDDVSFSVAEGEIFGILGPNGAGKTTTVECVIGLRNPDAGVIRVMGLDPHVDREDLHAIVGVQLQASVLPARLKVGEILDLFHSFYQHPAGLEEITDSLGLAEKKNGYYRSLSGGLKQRLSVALALIGNPKVAVLDEMTTGLDPQARRDTWQLIEGVRDRGVTIILVTHYMDEAERLCDRVALLDRGRIVAIDTPEGLADRAGVAKRVRFVPSKPFEDRLLSGLSEVRSVEHEGEHVIVTGSGELANVVILTLAAAGVTATDMHLDSANLEDAFVQMTGRHLHEDEIGRVHR
ncbi:MAG TPA: multidrug ABC transporter ATP-binding protein [Actinobacteria bacterium]|nr:multidrug ABC transporter ATP-binding protein [Actinomycetota bacterium]